MNYRWINYERAGDVAIIRLNDEKTINAASCEMVDELRLALGDASSTSRAIILTGAGRGFCSGFNLAGGIDPSDPRYDAGAVLETHFNPLILLLRDLPIPFLTAINGPAAGIGCAIALAGDIILASQGSYLLMAFGRVGLIPDGGVAYMLTRAAGRVRAMEMMLLGNKIPAEQALRWGLISRVVPEQALESEALATAQALAAGPTRTLAAIRRLCWRALDTDLSAQLEVERAAQREAGGDADHREGLAAFLEKRAPNFRRGTPSA
ncbi:MAG: enoyl-CoA hydratase-related protein [Pseudomonadota bacterium]|nr:enoyl-CoA hydratase-related protein [Pseudomonadota bacterium]